MKDNKKQIIVVGAGNWVKLEYAPALKFHKERGECGVYFLYDTSYAESQGFTKAQADRFNQFTEKNVEEFTSWGATCYDVAEEENQPLIKAISPDAVFVVTADNTHCKVVEEWLDRARNIFVEKPFDVDDERIRQLRKKINSPGSVAVVKGFDHYLVRANQFKMMRDYLRFDEHMEEQIHEFRFHMLESLDRGMIERSASIQSGMIMDMGSHTPALVWPFGDPNTIRLDTVKAGIYEPNPAKGIESSGREIMISGMETFAEVRFTFTSIFGQTVAATARVGKCVGERDEKYVEVVGGKNRDRKVRLDLSNFVVDFIRKAEDLSDFMVDFVAQEEEEPVTSLFPKSVMLLVREVIYERAESLALFDPGVGQDVVARLKEWRRPIIRYVKGSDDESGEIKNPLPGYPAKAPLDQILSTLSEL